MLGNARGASQYRPIWIQIWRPLVWCSDKRIAYESILAK